MVRLSTCQKLKILFVITFISSLSIPHILLANEPIATIGNPLPIKQVFLNDNTILQVVPTHFQIIDANAGNVIEEFGSITDRYRVWLSSNGAYIANANYLSHTKDYTINV